MAMIDISAIPETFAIKPGNAPRGKAGTADSSFKGNLQQAVNAENSLNLRNGSSSSDQHQRIGLHKIAPETKIEVHDADKHMQNGALRKSTILDGINAINTRLLIQREISTSPELQPQRGFPSDAESEADGDAEQPALAVVDPSGGAASQLPVTPVTEGLEIAAALPNPAAKINMPATASVENSQFEVLSKDKPSVLMAKTVLAPDNGAKQDSSPAEGPNTEYRLLEAQFQKFHGGLDRQKVAIADSTTTFISETGGLQVHSVLHANSASLRSIDKLSLKLSTCNDGYITCDIQKTDGSLDIVMEAAGPDYEHIRGRENELKRTLDAVGVVVDDVKLQVMRSTDRQDSTDTAVSGSATGHVGNNAMGDARRNESKSGHVVTSNHGEKYAKPAEANLPLPDRSSGIYV